ncbi:MAG: sulfatase [Planctomycetota bacterium]|nr:sulfatase [Planctomycetota bacterium]MDP6991008.1 sulfatase [Planctomycetota bacterium]
MSRQGLLAVAVGVAGLSLIAFAMREEWMPRRALGTAHPVIVIDVDTLRADRLGHYGYERETSPRFDAFAAEATAFAWAFAQAPFTVPSQTSIFTGLYPTRHGRIDDKAALPDAVVPLAEVLSEAGYDTAAFVDGGYMGSGYGLERGFDVYDDRAGGLAAIGPRVEEWLGTRLADDDPFFLLVHTYDVHTPYDSSPEPYRSMFVDPQAMPSPEFRALLGPELLRIWEGRHDEDPPRLSAEQLAYVEGLYDGGIRYVDTWLGEFLDGLKERGLYDDALIVFLSDHGEEFFDHGGVMHDKLFTPVSRIPLVLKLPGQREGGSVEAVVESIDVLPTILEVLELDALEDIDGASLLSLIDGSAPASEQVAISESPFYGRQIAVATDTHHMLTSRKTRRVELFSYRTDPREQADLSVELPELAARLARFALEWHDVVEKLGHEQQQATGVKQETLDQLEALGYTGD